MASHKQLFPPLHWPLIHNIKKVIFIGSFPKYFLLLVSLIYFSSNHLQVLHTEITGFIIKLPQKIDRLLFWNSQVLPHSSPFKKSNLILWHLHVLYHCTFPYFTKAQRELLSLSKRLLDRESIQTLPLVSYITEWSGLPFLHLCWEH